MYDGRYEVKEKFLFLKTPALYASSEWQHISIGMRLTATASAKCGSQNS